MGWLIFAFVGGMLFGAIIAIPVTLRVISEQINLWR